MAIDIHSRGSDVVVALTGFDRIFALKSRLEIPKDRISAVDVKKRRELESEARPSWLRMPGAHVPGLVRHGSYGLDPRREFWAVYRQENVLVISLRDWEYIRLVLGIPNPWSVASWLQAP